VKIKRIYQEIDYPLMRDPKRQPKCYDMTEEERLEAIKRIDALREKQLLSTPGYYGPP
jgi:hypothetical protein